MFRFSPLFLDLQNLRSRTNRAGPTQNSTTAEATGHTAPARGLWQMTFGAVNSGAGRIFATILSGPNVFSGFFSWLTTKSWQRTTPLLPSDSKLFFCYGSLFLTKKKLEKAHAVDAMINHFSTELLVESLSLEIVFSHVHHLPTSLRKDPWPGVDKSYPFFK